MSTKNNIVKKSGTIALATVLVGSSLLSTLPVNVFASEEALKNAVAEAAPTAAPANATEVSTFAELKAALDSKTITDIKLMADIKVTATFNFTTQKNLYGNGYTLDMNNNKIGVAKADSVNRIEDLTITNQNIYPLFWSEYAGVQVTYKNVTSSGKQFIYNAKGTAILEGNIKATSNYEEIFQGTNLIVKEGADVDFSSVDSNGTALYVVGNLTQEANSSMKVNSKSYTLYVANSSTQISIAGNLELRSATKQAIYATGGNMVVKTGAKFKADAGDTVEEGISITNGSLTVQSGADFIATSKGLQGTVQTGKALTFENGSNFAITNTNATGSVFANYAGASTKININSDRGLSTWDYGFINNDKPTHNYNDFKTATFDLSGYDKGNLSQKNLTSNSAQFQSQFVSKTTGKLFGGSYALTNIAQTTIDDLTTDSTKVVGIAEPNANIVIKDAAGKVLGSGRVGSDGYYEVTIGKQVAGTVVTATADSNGITSSASTTVIQASIEQTTIAALTTDSKTATGTAEPNADIEIKANGEVIGSGKVASDGKYSIAISQQDVGTRVTATATKGTATSHATTTVTQGDLDQTTISALTTKSTTAEGTAEPNATIEIKNNAGDLLGSGKVGSDGKYSITIPKQTVGTEVIAIATSNGKTSTAQTTVVRGEIDATTINKVTTESVSVSGTAEPNATLVVTDQDGKQLATGRVGSDGIYGLTIGKQPEGTTISVTASLGGFTSKASTIVERDGIDQTTINALTTDSVSVSGKAEPNATIVITDQNDKQLATGRVGSDGIYLLTIAKQPEGTVVTATATKDGKTSEAHTTVIRDAIAPTTINALTADSTNATGTAEPNADIVIKNGAGTTIGSGKVGSDGKYNLTIDKQTAGTVVTAKATKDGKTASAETVVTAGKDIAPTTINALTTDSVNVTGTAEPNADIEIKNGAGTTIASGKVGSDGKYSLTIDKQPEGTVVTAIATKDGKSKYAQTTVIRDAISPTTIDALTADDTVVKGTAEPNAAIVITDTAGSAIASGTVGSDGKYNFFISKQAAGTVITATATKNGKIATAETVVAAGQTIAPTTINALTTDSVTATGTAEPNADIVLKNGAGTTIGSGKVGSDGKYSLAIDKQVAGTVVTATATKNGKTASATTTVVDNHFAAPTINDYYVNDGYVSGTAPAGAKKVTIEVGGNIIRTVDVAANGTYRVYVNDNAAMGQAGTVFHAYATDANGKTSDKASSTVKAKAVVVAPPTINNYVVDSGYVTGKATAPATKVTISIGGKDVRTGDVAADGTFKIYVNDNADFKVVGKEFTAVAKDAAGNVSQPAKSTVQGTQLAQPTIDAYYAGQEYVTGKTDKATSKIGLYDKDGNLLRYGAVDAATGTYKIYASDKTSMRVVGDEFSVKAIDVAGTATAPTKSTILTAILGKPSIDDYNKGDEYVTGKTDLATSKIGLYDSQGNLLRTGLVNPDGTYKIYASDKAFMQVIGNVFTVRAINSANVPGVAATSPVLGERVPSKVTAAAYNLGDNNITGTYSGAGAKVQLFVNGVLVKNGALDTATGTYQVYAKDYIKAATDNVEIVLYDKNWQELDRTKVDVKAAAGQTLKITPDTYTIGDSNLTGTIDGVSQSIKLYVNGELARTGQISGDGKTFVVYAQDKIKSVTDVVTVVGVDKDGKEVTAPVTVKAASEAPDALKIGAISYKLNTDNLTGSYTGTMNGVELWVNGVKARTGGFDATAQTFTVYAKDKITSTSDVVQIKGYDKNWNVVTIDVTVN
ncbi:autolysin modifier protein [Listeria booriae]|uniref:Ig-like domain-containing protein n=1 Tax=Listeria booriae TaxID=1552123 RepID=UPI0016283178|nr:Ig-like domain-containing protein [Listeria booriae]MBC2367456.1 autolysin modifier protein [Listeria booriae]